MKKKQRAWVGAALVAATASIVSTSAFAVDNVWVGTTTDWNTPTNWSLGRVPTNANGAPSGDTFDDAVIDTNVLFPVINADLAAIPRDIVIASGAGNIGRVDQTAGTASTGGGNWLFIGRNGGNGTYNLGNTSTTGGTFTGIGQGSGSVHADGRIYVAGDSGAAGVGLFNINTTGTVTSGNDMSIGAASGVGTVNLDAGTVSIGGWLSVGRDENGNAGTGNWNQSGGAVTVAGNTAIALTGTHGNFTMTGGTHTTSGEFWVGSDVFTDASNVRFPSVGVANITGGTVTMNNWLAVGRNGAVGTLNITGTGVVQKIGAGNITIGTGAGGFGTVNVSAGVLSTDTDFLVAENDPTDIGVVNQSGGQVKVGGNLEVQRTGTGTYKLNGGTLSVDGHIDGLDGTFTFTGGRIARSNAGAIVYNGNLTVGNKAAGFALGTDRTITVNGILDVTPGVTFDVTGDAIPTAAGAGAIHLGSDTSIIGTFDPITTSLPGLNANGATFISEIQGEGGLFPATQSVYWVQENGGSIDLKYSVAVPEPTTLGVIGLSSLAFMRRRRRK